MLESMNTCQEYMRDAHSRPSYCCRWMMKCGMVWYTKKAKMTSSMKMENIWFWSPEMDSSAW